MRCPACHGWFRREPARLVCTSCALELVVIGAHPDDYAAQRALDAALRPVRIECRDLPPPPPDDAFSPIVPARRLWSPS